MEDMSSSGGQCGYTEEVSTLRFLYISFSGIIAIAGFISNILLLYVFTTKRMANSPPNLYPAILSILDAILCLLFVFVFVLDVNMIYLKNLKLFILYHQYIIVAFATAKIVQFLIPYMLMLATFERYTWITNNRKYGFLKPNGRYISLIFITIFGISLRMPSALSLKVAEFTNCTDAFRRLAVDQKDWAKEEEFFVFYDFYAITLLQTFLPFIILMVLNITIVNRLSQIDTKNRNVKEDKIVISKRRSTRLIQTFKFHRMPMTVRNAVFTMVAIVFSYLISNTLHIILTVLEVGKASILVEDDDPYKASMIYTILGDGVSILYMFSSAIRIHFISKIFVKNEIE
ncbi:unnamed protein product [Auanema sp. JU1783]|nr:unnamed protein product [Auanema sp. JU1783]